MPARGCRHIRAIVQIDLLKAALAAAVLAFGISQTAHARPSNFAICSNALDPGTSGWDSRPQKAQVVALARQSGLTPQTCAGVILCKGALSTDRTRWEDSTERQKFVQYAISAGLTVRACNALLGDESDGSTAQTAPIQAVQPDHTIVSIQSMLMSLGYDAGGTDGVVGPRTSAAIAAFQRDIGEEPTGQPSEALRAKLQAAVSSRSAGRQPPSRDRVPEREGGPKFLGSGTGFFIGQNTLVTNFHVVGSCGQIRLRNHGEGIGGAKVQTFSKEDDLAILRTEAVSHQVLRLRVAPALRPAEQIVVFGFPLAGELSTLGNTTIGYVTAITGLGDDSRYIQISAPVQPGNSGGPALDSAGRLTGVVTSKLNTIAVARTYGDIPQNVNFAIRSSALANFLDVRDIPYTRASSGDPEIPATDVAQIAERASVHILCFK